MVLLRGQTAIFFFIFYMGLLEFLYKLFLMLFRQFIYLRQHKLHTNFTEKLNQKCLEIVIISKGLIIISSN